MYNKHKAACGMVEHSVDPSSAGNRPEAGFRIREASHIVRGAAVVACAVLIAACSSGGGGENPIFGNGQQPDPATVDYPVAYVKRTLPVPPQQLQEDARLLRSPNVDADLYVRDRASPSAEERNITARVTGEAMGEDNLWDVKDLESSFAGRKVVFAMRGPMIPNAEEENQPTWNIWEYDFDSDTLRQVIASAITAEEGNDVAPHYLPDGRIVFSSTRQRQSKAILLDEGKPQFEALNEDRNEPAFVLHVMNPDGSDIHQISFNQSHDLDPTVLTDGRILFTRWDHAPNNNGMHLYTMNPDGRNLELLFGANSHIATNFDGSPIEIQYLQPRQLEDGRILTLLRPFVSDNFAADLGGIDTENYVEDAQPILPNVGVLTGPAVEGMVVNDVRLGLTSPSPGGVFSAAFPILDGSNRLFVSWSLCRVLEEEIVPCTEERLDDPNAVAAPPLYGIWIYNLNNDTQLPVVPPEEGIMITDIVAMKPRTPPAVILDGVGGVDLDLNLVDERAGVLHIRSVYDIDGVDTVTGGIASVRDPGNAAYATRPARFLRIEKAVSIPDEDVRDFSGTAFGVGNVMREILGYTPIEPDGSVQVKVPADVAFAISFLDRSGRRISVNHDNWLQVRPGEVLECNGCHDPGSGLSHGRRNLFAAANPGAPATGEPFPNTHPALTLNINPGDTMAQVRARAMCNGACPLSVNVVFDDLWPAASITPEASFDYCYSMGPTDIADDPADPSSRHSCTTGLTTLAPVTSDCERAWSSGCRIVINYETHIHPIWGVNRLVPNNIGIPVNRTCTNCHAPPVPAGQLDLSDGPSNQQPAHFNSYRELLQPFNMGPMTPGSALTSTRFFSRFDAGGSHDGYLTTAEKRLIAEWLDIGAQYYNNPFAAPLN